MNRLKGNECTILCTALTKKLLLFYCLLIFYQQNIIIIVIAKGFIFIHLNWNCCLKFGKDSIQRWAKIPAYRYPCIPSVNSFYLSLAFRCFSFTELIISLMTTSAPCVRFMPKSKHSVFCVSMQRIFGRKCICPTLGQIISSALAYL